MSSKRSIKMFIVDELGEFPHFMVWAVLEWILIVSLYIDGFVAFMSSQFAKIFELDPPCVLCTRVDHALVGKDPNSYYNESICECHKKDISSLAYCHVHMKLCDIQKMCEGCLLSFASEKELDTDTDNNKCMQIENDAFTERGKVVRDYSNYNDDVSRCSCCGEPLKMKASSKGYARSFSNVRGSVVAAAHSPRASVTSIASPRALTTPTAWKTEDSRYTELKFISDNDPDMPEDDFGFSIDAKFREDMNSGTMALLPDSDEMNDESCETPNFIKGNKFFGIPLTDSTTVSPQWANKITKKVTLEKPETLTDINNDTSADGDSSLQYLKKQVRMDRKSLIALYMELDEERSAAAVAANNAMAMITRLQAEKAAVQMEALQYQRMMEEQAEYDQEAIQILKDMLAKSDEDMKIMELELDGYREKYGEIRKVGSDECEADGDEYYQEWRSHESLSSFGEKSECWSIGEKDIDEDGESPSGRSVENENEKENSYEESSLNFENEKHQLYSMLKNLENHIETASDEDEWDEEDKDIVEENRECLKREVSQIKERLRAIEADSGFLKQTAVTLQKHEKGAKLLKEIALHLMKIRNSESSDNLNVTDT